MVLPGNCSPLNPGQYGFTQCRNTDDCPCPQFCAPDPAFPVSSRNRCESLCTTESDCTDPTTRCVGGLCQLQTCEIADTACSILDAGDGTCLPGYLAAYNTQGAVQLVCESAGSASALCDAEPTALPALDRTEPQILCPVGQVCVSSEGFNFGSCFPVCNPDGGGVCDAGTQCVQMGFGDGPEWGACLAPDAGSS